MMNPETKARKAAIIPRLTNPILMPAVDSFDELFERAAKIPDLSCYKSTEAHIFSVADPYNKRRKGVASISSFMTLSGEGRNDWYDVMPRPSLADVVKENMLLVPDYRINFEVRVWDDGLALVTAHYNMISGSRWFAIVDESTLPK